MSNNAVYDFIFNRIIMDGMNISAVQIDDDSTEGKIKLQNDESTITITIDIIKNKREEKI